MSSTRPPEFSPSRSDDDLERLRLELRERRKELALLHALLAIEERRELSLDAHLREVLALVPPALLHEDGWARIVLDDQDLSTPGQVDGGPVLDATIVLAGVPAGRVEIGYRHEHPPLDEGPFLREERAMIDSIARAVARVVEGKRHLARIEESSRELGDKNRALAAANQQLAATEQQLRAHGQELAATNEELAATNDELAAANEELAAANEELAATNEELAAANQQLAATEQQLRAHGQQLMATNEQLAATEKELRRSEAAFRSVFEASNVAKSMTRISGEVVPNHALCVLLGYEADELGRMRWQDLTPAEDVPRCESALAPLLSGERDGVRFEKRYVRKDGAIVRAYVATVLHRDADGRPLHFITTVVDVTERRVAEARLRESEERFRQIYEHAAIGLARVSLDGRIEGANAAYCAMLGMDEARLVGKSLVDITLPEVLEENLKMQARLVVGEIDHYRMQKAFLHADGHVVHGVLDACLVRDGEGRPAYCLGSVVDVTERDRAVADLHGRQRELEVLFRGARTVLETEDFATAARHLFDGAKAITGARSGYVALLDSSGTENELLFLDAGGRPCSVDPELPMPVRGLRARAYETGEAVYENAFAQSPWMRFMPEGHVALENVLFAPIAIDERVVGIIGLANKPGDFDERDRDFATAMGRLVALSYQKGRAEHALRAERDGLEAVMETVPVAILLADETLRITRVNRAARSLFRLSEGDEIGRVACGDVIGCVHRRDAPEGCGHDEACRRCALYRAIREGLAGRTVEDVETSIETEVMITGGDGSQERTVVRRHILLGAAPLTLENRPGVILAVNDITETRDLHARMAQSDRLSSMGMLAAGVAHEINNPLAYLLHAIESLREEMPGRIAAWTGGAGGAPSSSDAVASDAAARATAGSDAPASVAAGSDAAACATAAPDAAASHAPGGDPADDLITRLDEALDGCLRIRDIARGLGSFSRVERDEIVPVDVGKAIRLAAKMCRNEIKFRARLKLELGDCPEIMASEGRLAQVFLNLLINASHAIDEGDIEGNEIRVRCWREGAELLVRIDDTGRGIAPEHMPLLFEPFFSTKEIGRGSGLGLPISKSIVESYGGRIELRSEPGRGTSFTLRFPVPETVPTAAEAARAVEESSEGPAARILVVDDEAFLRRAVRRMLRGHETVEAANGAEARKLLAVDGDFDLVLCDLMMPELSGFELHAWVGEHDPELAARFVFMSGGAFTPAASAYMDGVENPRIEKPFHVADLRRIVHEGLGTGKRRRRRPVGPS